MSRTRGRPANSTSALVPAASRTDSSAVADIEVALNAEAVEVFSRAVGGRAQLTEVLAVAGGSAEIERITTLLLDPRYASWSLARLCATVGLTVAELFTAYRKALIMRAHIRASHIIASKLPPVVDDVMTRAAPQRAVCPKCLGTSAAGQGPCPQCQDAGFIQTEPDLDRQKLALELGQLLEKKGGFIVQQNNVAATLGATAPGSLEQLQQAVGDLLFNGGRSEVVEADEVRGAPPAELPEVPDDDEAPELPFEDVDTGDPLDVGPADA